MTWWQIVLSVLILGIGTGWVGVLVYPIRWVVNRSRRESKKTPNLQAIRGSHGDGGN